MHMSVSKPIPELHSDEEAACFVDEADLTQYDLSGFKPMHFELVPKNAALHMRIPEALLDAVKERAADRGIPYTRYVRLVLEEDIARHQ